MSAIHQSAFMKMMPKFLRNQWRDYRIKKTILDYYSQLPENELDSETREALAFLKSNPLPVFPYAFQNQYKRSDIQVFEDKDLNLKYVINEGKRLYFKKKSSKRGIKRNYNFLLIEQDHESPHRYLTNDFNIHENDILVDVGAAEGNLALSVIEKVKKVYLFETDERWIEALKATFAPWKDKVEIVNQYVSDFNDEKNVALDDFFKDKEPYTFLKIDAEGAEAQVLNGARLALASNQPLKVAVCCYHQPNDAKELGELLSSKGFESEFSKGLMIFNEPKTFYPPYLRKGVLRAFKE
jgi:2-polyprenyl-3-methyl-5-hydroxy-6-metoxy-1,4-benzoquinol methylase